MKGACPKVVLSLLMVLALFALTVDFTFARRVRRDGLQPPVVRDPLEGALCKVHEIADPFYKARVLTNMAAKFSAAQQRESALALLRHARETAAIIPIPHDKSWALANIGYEYVKAGEVTRGMIHFSKAHKMAVMSGDKRSHDTLFTEMSLLCSEANLFDLALRIADSIDDFWSRSVAVSKVCVGLIHAGQFERAIKEMEALVGKPNRSFVQADLARAFGRAGQVKKALELTRDLQCPLKKAQTIAAIAEAQLEEDRIEQALKITRSLDVKKNPHAANYKCGMLIRISAAVEQNGRFGRSFKILKEARRVALEVKSRKGRSRSLAGVAATHAEAHQQLRSAWILDDGLRIAGRLAEPEERLDALLWICKRLFRAGMKAEAKSLLEHCRQSAYRLPNLHNDRDKHIAEVARLYLGIEHWYEVLRLARYIANPNLRTSLLVDFSRQAIIKKRWDIAFNAVTALRYKDIAVGQNAMLDIASLYIQSDRYTDALRTLRMINASDLRAIGLAELAAQYLRRQRKPSDDEMYHIRHIAKRIVYVVRPACNDFKSHLRPPRGLHLIQRPDEDVRNAATWQTQP